MTRMTTTNLWGIRSARGIITPARDEKQARDWAAYDHRAHKGAGEVLVSKAPGQDWEIVEDAA